MKSRKQRREILKLLGATSAAGLLQPITRVFASGMQVAGREIKVTTSHLSPRTVRITLAAQGNDARTVLAQDGAVILPLPASSAAAAAKSPTAQDLRVTEAEALVYRITDHAG